MNTIIIFNDIYEMVTFLERYLQIAVLSDKDNLFPAETLRSSPTKGVPHAAPQTSGTIAAPQTSGTIAAPQPIAARRSPWKKRKR